MFGKLILESHTGNAIARVVGRKLRQLIIEKEIKMEQDKIGFKKYSMLALNLLFMSKRVQVLKCFKKNNADLDEVLVKIKDNYDFNIFGDKYQKTIRKDLNI